MFLLHTEINTDLIQDCFVIPIRDKNVCVEWLLSEILQRYHEWHPFKVYEFEIYKINNSLVKELDKKTKLLNLINNENNNNRIILIESELSKLKRKEDEEKEEELRLERLRIEQEKKEKRKLRINEISSNGNCWELTKYSEFLNVPIEKEKGNGQIVINTGSLDQWCSIRFISAILPAFNKFYFSIKILELPSTTNTWKICIGAVPIQFKINADRHWIGSQHSWSYIAGTGGKCYNSGKSQNYGDSYKEGDIISMLLNFENGTIEFFKNNISQGIAFKNLKNAVIPAVSLTAKGSKLKLLNLLNDKYLPKKYKPFMIKNVEIIKNQIRNRQYYLSQKFELKQTEIWQKYKINMLYPRFSSYRNPISLYFNQTKYEPPIINNEEKEEKEENIYNGSICNLVLNGGSGDKWRIVRSFGAYYPDDNSDDNLESFQFEILNDGKSTNTWRMCIGVIPIEYDSTNDKIWVGAQSSWSYIAGTGGKCFNSSQSTSYGERYTTNDKISVLLDFNNLSIEFFKNGESQGIAFENCKALKSGVYAAISMTASNAKIKFNSFTKKQSILLRQNGIKQREILMNIMDIYGNIWDQTKMTKNKNITIIDKMLIDSISNNDDNNDNKDKWNCIGSLLSYQTGRRYFEVELLSLINTKKDESNSKSSKNNMVSTSKWKVCIGIVPKSFKFNHSKNKLWIGAQNSWSLIIGNGHKCYNSNKSTIFTNEKFNINDKIGVLMDFDNHTLEFYKNDKCLGEAFNNLYGPVYAAISIANNFKCKLKFRPQAEKEKMDKYFLFH